MRLSLGGLQPSSPPRSSHASGRDPIFRSNLLICDQLKD